MKKSFSLRKLIDLDELQSIQDAFANGVGVSSVIISPEGELLTKFTNPTGFCSLIQSTDKGKEFCLRFFREASQKALESKEPKIFYCPAHGGHFTAPILIHGEHRGTMFAGQFILEKFSPEQLQNLKKIAPEIDLDPELLIKEAEKMRVIGEDVIRKYSGLLFRIVKTIARIGTQAAEQSQARDTLLEAHDELEQEVAERKAVEQALRESEEKMRSMTDAAQDAVIIMDNDGNISYWNKSAERILGYTEEEIMGKKFHAVFVPERFYESHLKGFKMFRETGQGPAVGKTLELAAIRKDGTEFPVEISLSSVKLKGKWNAIGILRDITKRKQREKELEKKKNEKMERLNKLTVGREIKMIELKKEINALLKNAGDGPRYKIVGED